MNKIKANISKTILKRLYISMAKIRLFEERVGELLLANEIKCPTHLYIGQEAIAVGVCMNLRTYDYVLSTHRSHGHYIAKGGDMNSLMAELFCKKTGCSKGKGGSMHLVDPGVNYLGSSAIVAGSIPIAVGVALASDIQNSKKVTVAFFGDGATDEGVFYESLNFAALYKLPVLFVCENNLFSTHLPILYRHPADNIYKIARDYMINTFRINGNDAMDVFLTAKQAIEDLRKGKGPVLIECRTFRWRSHVGPWQDLDVGLRKKKDVEHWMKKCPIKALEKLLKERGYLLDSEKNTIYSKITSEISSAYRFAKNSRYPNKDDLTKDVLKNSKR